MRRGDRLRILVCAAAVLFLFFRLSCNLLRERFRLALVAAVVEKTTGTRFLRVDRRGGRLSTAEEVNIG